MQVRAIKTLYVEHKRRREGDVFELSDEKYFSKRSMTKLDAVVEEEAEAPSPVKAKGKPRSKAKNEETKVDEVI